MRNALAAPVRGAPGEYTVTIDFGARRESDENAWITAIYSVNLDPARDCRVLRLERTE